MKNRLSQFLGGRTLKQSSLLCAALITVLAVTRGYAAENPNPYGYRSTGSEPSAEVQSHAPSVAASEDADTVAYFINPAATRQSFEGWGISLCWWANMCGKWDDDKIEELVNWLVSSDGLNYNIFRYNIGGGDDPENRNCTEHHMASGKGLRAEMEGFKDSTNGEYVWDRDEAQRKIMLKIKDLRSDAVFEAFSNSCPYYMTYSGCCAGNTDAGSDNLRPEYYEEFANYLVDVCAHYKETYGIEFKTLEPFNESQTSYWGAGGGQEGCHFDLSSQIAFLEVLQPILKASGLNTVISASDETDVAQTIDAFKAYEEAGIGELIGQWNTHTYSGTNISRSKLSALVREEGTTLWMSEVGMSGSGISGNLNMAQRLMDDIRYLLPDAWIDWQYVEENNDQWCMVMGDFDEQTYEKVKNYSVRQQFSKFIKKGYTFLTTTVDETLAARNEAGDTVVIVMVNNEAEENIHKIDLSLLGNLTTENVKSYRTSEYEDVEENADFTLTDNVLVCSLPAYSATTLVIATETTEADNKVSDGGEYLVVARSAQNLVLTADEDGVSIEEFTGADAQLWTLEANGVGYMLVNREGQRLTGDEDNYYLSVTEAEEDGQTFLISSIDYPFYKIEEIESERSLDLENEKNTEGTAVGLWSYGSDADAFHRQWLLLKTASGDDDNVSAINSVESSEGSEMLSVTCRNHSMAEINIDSKTEGILNIYSANGSLVWSKQTGTNSLSVPLGKGVYVVNYRNDEAHDSRVIAVE